MNFEDILSDKSIKPKVKTETLSLWLLSNPKKTDELIDFSKGAKDPIKATCIEAFEFATKTNPEIASLALLKLALAGLSEKAPRIKWESAKVLGNIAHLFPKHIKEITESLLLNTNHPGTVVRWSAAFALGEILKLKSPINKNLITIVNEVIENEEKNSIKKIYLTALKKISK